MYACKLFKLCKLCKVCKVCMSAGDLVSETLMGSNPAFKGRQLVSFPFEYRLSVPEHRN